MARRFYTLDVFTSDPLAGNPLAVVLDAEGLDAARMQSIAAEYNLSETVFVLPPQDPRQRADIRIFTPARELPFAGHPTVGTAVLMALLNPDREAKTSIFGLKEQAGVIACVVEIDSERKGFATFRLPRLPSVWGEGRDAEECAEALGLNANEIGFGRHVPSRHSAGVPFDLVPVVSPAALARAAPSGELFDEAFTSEHHAAAYAYTRLEDASGIHFRARMFSSGLGIAEDPATGAAAAAFAGALMQCEPLGDGQHQIVIEQGVEMGRPSEIALRLEIGQGKLISAEIGGHAVLVSSGTLFL